MMIPILGPVQLRLVRQVNARGRLAPALLTGRTVQLLEALVRRGKLERDGLGHYIPLRGRELR